MIDAAALVEFFDVPIGGTFDVAPTKAIEYFKAKGLKPTFSYAEMLNEAHDHAFTVAKMTNVDMLAQVRASLDSALANGTSFKEWSDGIVPLLQSGGWWGRKEVLDPLTGQTIVAQLGSPWRLETIFRTNMQSAYAAGQWQEITTQQDIAPWLMYDAVDDLRTRPLHASWDRKILPVASAWWKTHYPPNGWNCRCGVIQLTDDEIQALGLEPASAPPDNGTYTWQNPRTGTKHQVPLGLDPGFEHNSGVTYLADLDKLLLEKIASLPPDMKAAATSIKATVGTAEAIAKADAGAAIAADQAAAAAAKKAIADQEANAAAMAQLKAIAGGDKTAIGQGAGYLTGALDKLQKSGALAGLSPAQKLKAVQEAAALQKLKTETASKLSTYKKAVLEGKIPAPALVKALKSLPDEDQAAFLAKLDQEVAAASAAKAAAKAAEEAKAAAAAQAAAQAKAEAEAAAAAAAKAQASAAKAAATKAAKAQAKAEATAKAATQQQAAVATAQGAPDPKRLVKIGEQRGSNPGGTYQDPETGAKWYIKTPASADIARNELLGGKLYELAGVEVPEMHLITLDGKPAIASRIIDGLEKGTAAQLAKASGALEGFGVDAWLSNWDVVGMGYDNLLIKAGRAIRVDTGGSLLYRAQGGLKGDAFGTVVEELTSLRQATNRQAASVFGKITEQQLDQAVARVLAIPEADIRAAVERMGPTDAAQRALLADKLIARQRWLAQARPDAARLVRAPEPPAALPTSRVTAAEQKAIEASRANGYTFTTDGDSIEDNGVLVSTLTRSDGKPGTRGYLKLRPEAGARLLEQISKSSSSAPVVDLGDVRSQILAALKSVNLRAAKGEALPENVYAKVQTAMATTSAAITKLRNAIKVADLASARKLEEQIAYLERWNGGLQQVVRAQVPKPVLGGEQFHSARIPTQLTYKLKASPAAGSGPKWQRSTSLQYETAKFDKGAAIEGKGTGTLYGVGEHYTAILDDGTRLTYIPHSSSNARATQGALRIDVPGKGAASSERVFGAMQDVGLPIERSSTVDRQLLYLNAFARLRLIRDAPAGAMSRFSAIKEVGEAGVRKRLQLIKTETGVDVEKSEGWAQLDGVRQAFGHGRAFQLRPDLDTPEFRKLETEGYQLFHNPKGLGHDASAGVSKRVLEIVDGGGQFASLMDRFRRGVALDGSSVHSDLGTGGGDYTFTRILKKNKGAGLYWKPRLLRRMDAISYGSDQFGNTAEDHILANRQGQTPASIRKLANGSSNETIFKGGLSLFDDLDTIVVASDTERAELIAGLKARGYAKWPDGRTVEEVVLTRIQKEKRNGP